MLEGLALKRSLNFRVKRKLAGTYSCWLVFSIPLISVSLQSMKYINNQQPNLALIQSYVNIPEMEDVEF